MPGSSPDPGGNSRDQTEVSTLIKLHSTGETNIKKITMNQWNLEKEEVQGSRGALNRGTRLSLSV